MPVRIFFRGLVLFRFPTTGPDANKLVAELISEPVDRPHNDKVPKGQDDHQAEIQVITGEDAHQLVPRELDRYARVDIKIGESTRDKKDRDDRDGNAISRSRSFDAYVPDLPQLATMTTPNLKRGPREDDRYLRNTITVSRGQIRVQDVVIWEAGGFPFRAPVGANPSLPARVRFMATGLEGHAANECVVEAEGTDIVDIDCKQHPELDGLYRSTRRRNQRAQEGTTDILIRNYEYQRTKPVPWGLDFQWLFARLGYPPIDLAGGNARAEFDAFVQAATNYSAELFGDDRASLLPASEGHPFPYILSDKSFTALTPLHPSGSPATDIYSRPVCVPGRG